MGSCRTTTFATALAVFGLGISAPAATFTFNFDSLASGVAATGGVGATGSIQNYMNSVLGAAGSVAVSGVNGGGKTDKYYDGDGHVVGPSCLGGGSTGAINSATSACGGTLGTDTFVKSFSTGGTASFTFAFTLPSVVIDSVSFDYEIFPDGTCLALDNVNCGGAGNPNKPDMIFATNLGQVFHDYGATPLSTANNSWLSTTELTPQKLVTGYNYVTPAGVNSFTFTDWPATIGIDNFVITYHTTTGGGSGSVPEPGAIILLGTVACLLAGKFRRKYSQSQV